MHIVDSSAWLEYFADTSHAKHFASLIEDVDHLLIPSIIIYEVFKKILRERGETLALQIVGHMQSGQVVDLDSDISLFAAKLSSEYHLPVADSIILATARWYEAIVWTTDSDFKGIEGVKYFSNK